MVERQGRERAAWEVLQVLQEQVRRERFQALVAGRLRVGRIIHRVLWHHDRWYRLVLDLEADAVLFPALLPATLPPQMLKTLRQSLLQRGAPGQTVGAGELSVFYRHGTVTLSMSVLQRDYQQCTRTLLAVADEVLGTFLTQPQWRDYLRRMTHQPVAAASLALACR